MRTIETSKNKKYPADYCGVGYANMLKMQIKDTRPLGEIAPEFEDLSAVRYIHDGLKETFKGYSRLNRIERINANLVVIILKDPNDQDEEIF